MTIVTSNAVILTTNADAVFQTEDSLVVDTSTGGMVLLNAPPTSLSRIAMAEAEGKPFVELEDAVLVIGE